MNIIHCCYGGWFCFGMLECFYVLIIYHSSCCALSFIRHCPEAARSLYITDGQVRSCINGSSWVQDWFAGSITDRFMMSSASPAQLAGSFRTVADYMPLQYKSPLLNSRSWVTLIWTILLLMFLSLIRFIFMRMFIWTWWKTLQLTEWGSIWCNRNVFLISLWTASVFVIRDRLTWV